jgi:Condensation domain
MPPNQKEAARGPRDGEATSFLTFSGASSRSGPASWGQRWIWDVLDQLPHRDRARLNNSSPVLVLPGAGLERVTEAVRATVLRHESLRTTIGAGADGDLEQVVHAEGRVSLTIRDLGDRWLLEAAESLVAEVAGRTFDPARELPVRAGLLTAGGCVIGAVLVGSHLSVDGASTRVLRNELAGRIHRRYREPPATRRQWHPVDQALEERSEKGGRVSRRACAHWRAQLEAAAGCAAAGRRHVPDDPRYWLGEFRSVAAPRALAAVAARTGVAPSAVLHAALAVAVAERLETPSSDMLMFSANRFAPGLRSSVGQYSQSSPVHLDLEADTFDDLAIRSADQLMRTGLAGRFDPGAVAPLVRRFGLPAPTHLALPVVFNFRPGLGVGTPSVAGQEPGGIGRSASLSYFRWLDAVQEESLGLYVEVRDVSPELCLAFWVDTAFLPRTDVPVIASRVERLLAGAGTDATEPTTRPRGPLSVAAPAP